jgi:solute:Na+ symporter, SSS family
MRRRPRNLIRVMPAKEVFVMVAIDAVSGTAVLLCALLVFAWVGLRAGGDADVEEYTVARSSQTGGAIGLSFLASGLGAWILFTPPEVGATTGIAGVVGYAVAVVMPLVVLLVLGRRIRRLLPLGHGLTEFVRVRFGAGVHRYVVAISMMYMLVAVVAELTAAGSVLARLAGIDARVAIVAIVVVTLVYTAYGGLRASLRTDGWQAWLLLVLLGIAGVAMTGRIVAADAVPDAAGGLWQVDRAGVEGAATLIIAVVVTTLFHHGYWQRVWAARDHAALRRGAVIGALTRVPVLLAVGLAGLFAAARGMDLGDPPVPFFALLDGLPGWLVAVVIVLAVSLVASTVDTIENGMAALVATERPTMGLRGARVATVVLMLPATVAAFQGYSVLRLLLVADLLCAATVVPVLLGVWRRATTASAISGCVAGLLGAVGWGWIATGSLPEGALLVTLPRGLDGALGVFTAALVVSGVVALVVSLLQRRETDLSALQHRPRSLATAVAADG